MRQVGGVIHVGANDGAEIPEYLAAGRVPVLAFEPNPELFSELVARYRNEAHRVAVAGVALGHFNGWHRLWIPRHLHAPTDDSQSASLLRADRQSPYDWGGRDLEGRYVDVNVARFDTWLWSHPLAQDWWTQGRFADLVIDVQGYELQVLKGFGDLLDKLDRITVECSEVPIYEGGAAASDVAAHLAQYGFGCDSPLVPHGDVHFSRP